MSCALSLWIFCLIFVDVIAGVNRIMQLPTLKNHLALLSSLLSYSISFHSIIINTIISTALAYATAHILIQIDLINVYSDSQVNWYQNESFHPFLVLLLHNKHQASTSNQNRLLILWILRAMQCIIPATMQPNITIVTLILSIITN